MRDDYPFDKRTSGDLLEDTETTATVLLIILMTAYGDELLGNPAAGIEAMDPIECWNRVKEDFNAVVPECNENRINAIAMAVTTDAFYDDALAFVSICNGLYSGELGDIVDGVMEDLTLPELLWGIYEVELNRGQSQDFAPAIDAIINETIMTEANDNEDLEPEDVVPYYEKFVEAQRDNMLTQFKMLGVDDSIIANILKSDLTPAKELDEFEAPVE